MCLCLSSTIGNGCEKYWTVTVTVSKKEKKKTNHFVSRECLALHIFQSYITINNPEYFTPENETFKNSNEKHTEKKETEWQ